MEFILLQRDQVILRFTALTRAEANQTLRQRCTQDLVEYVLAQKLRVGTPVTTVTLSRVDEVDT